MKLAAVHDRVIAALERREPDRVPTMDMMFEYAKIYAILGKRPLPLGWLFMNKYASKALDRLAPGPLTPFFVEKSMDALTYDRTAAAVELGYDSAWVTYPPIWRYYDSKNMYDIGGKEYRNVFDGKGNLGTPMYTGGRIKSAEDWRNWPKKDLLRLPEKTHRFFSRLQKDFGEKIFIFHTFVDGVFGYTWGALGFKEFAVAARKERDFIERIVRFYTDLYCLMLEAVADAGVPGVIYPDDMAYRSGPMISPKQLESLYGESFRRITETAHGLGLKIVVHSCGNVCQLLEWFADCGFDGVHALEPTAGMDLAEVKRMVGDRLCLLGNMDVTHVLVDADRDEVFEAVRQSIAAAGPGGGYIIAPTNSHPDVSVERLRWLVEATELYGKYPLS